MTYEVAITSDAHFDMCKHLLQHYQNGSYQEDLCFALWRPSTGKTRLSALIDEVILPNEDDRTLHGNVSFAPDYLGRATWAACRAKSGLVFVHSHPSSGWQDLSSADSIAERDVISYTARATGLPLVGMTAGSDGYWSARYWFSDGNTFRCEWCSKVRVVDRARYRIYHNDTLVPPRKSNKRLKRTYETWGKAAQQNIERLNVGIVGLGSVGSFVAECMARIGVSRLTLIDPDVIEVHNLDRLLYATSKDVGKRKVSLVRKYFLRNATADRATANAIALGIQKEHAYRAALDCDVIFSCVDRPVARDVMNFIAIAHLIPVIDGGIAIESNIVNDEISSAHWRSHIVTPNHQCLRCNGQYDTSMVVMELDGSLSDPSYVANLPKENSRTNQNVFPFSSAVASMEVNMLLRFLTSQEWWPLVQQEDYQFVTCETRHINESCRSGCEFTQRTALGDSANPHYIEDSFERSIPQRVTNTITRWFRSVYRQFQKF